MESYIKSSLVAEKQFIIIKKIAKQGKQSVIVIPKLLEERLKPGTILKLTMDVLEESKQENKDEDNKTTLSTIKDFKEFNGGRK